MASRPVPPLPLLRRQSGRDDIRDIEGYAVSPAVAATSLFLAISYITMLAAPSPYVFATTTNLCYLASGFYREAVSATDRHSATLLVGQMAGGSIVFVLMGASSFAYHRDSQMNSPAHTLDIMFGWLLVSHVFYVSASVSILAMVRYCTPDSNDARGTRVVRSALSFGYLVIVVVIMTYYDAIYSHQIEFYFVAGPAAAIFGGICRFILVYEEEQLHWPAVRIAIAEMVVALTAVFAAILAQGELLGRKLNRVTTPDEYDFYHGQWHFLLALVVALLYSRAADAARIVQGTHRVCVCTLPFLDVMAELTIFIYALLVIVFKESSASLILAKGILGALSGVFVTHGLIVVLVSAFGDAGDPLVTPRAQIDPSPRGLPTPQLLPMPRGGYVPLPPTDVELGRAPALTFRIRGTR